MKITIAAIGRAARGPERDLYEHYASRIRWPLTLRELEEKKKLPPAQLIAREGELLLGVVPPKAMLVALDRRGKAIDSAALAERLRRWRDDGVADVAFLIGGSYALQRREHIQITALFDRYPTAQALLFMDRAVRARTGNSLRMSIFAGAQLGEEREVIEQTRRGVIDVARVNVSPLSNVVPELQCLLMPYLMRSTEHLRATLDGIIGEEMLKEIGRAHV